MLHRCVHMQHHPLTCGCPLLIAKYEPFLHARSYISASDKKIFLSISSFTQNKQAFTTTAHCGPITPLKGTHRLYGVVFFLRLSESEAETPSAAIGIFRHPRSTQEHTYARMESPRARLTNRGNIALERSGMSSGQMTPA